MYTQDRSDKRAGRPYLSAPNTITFPKPLRARAHAHVRLDREEQREWRANQAELYGNARPGRQIGLERAVALHHATVAHLNAVIEHREHVGAVTAADLNARFEPLSIGAQPLCTSGVAPRGPGALPTSLTTLVTTRPALSL